MILLFCSVAVSELGLQMSGIGNGCDYVFGEQIFLAKEQTALKDAAQRKTVKRKAEQIERVPKPFKTENHAASREHVGETEGGQQKTEKCKDVLPACPSVPLCLNCLRVVEIASRSDR